VNITKPYSEVEARIGKRASLAWEKLTAFIRYNYELDEDWREGNPAHRHHSNLRFCRGQKTLITLCIRENYFIAAIVLGREERDRFENRRKEFGEPLYKEYDSAEVFHDGKWLGFEIYDDSVIDDIIRLIQIKRKPNRKIMPKDIEICGRLDIGLSSAETTKIIY